MSRFDSPGSVVLLLSAAAAVSVVLILLLNAEARSRKANREPEIKNGNMFSELASKLKNWVSVWFNDTNSATPEVLVIETESWEAGHAGSRRLHWARDVPRATEEGRHHVRHGPKHPRGAAPHNASRAAPRLAAADVCYDTNDVLVIIGLTCVVNLAFVAAVLCLVHVCGRRKSRWSDVAALTTDGSDVPLLVPAEEPTTFCCCPLSGAYNVHELGSSFSDIALPRHKYAAGRRASSRSMEHLLFVG